MEPKNAKNALCIGALDLQRLKCRQQNLPQKGCNSLEGSNVRTLRCSNLEPMVPQKDALPISPTCSLFVFSINGLKQNARSLLTPLQIFILFYMVHSAFYSGPPLLTIHQCSCPGGGNHLTLSLLRDARKQ